MSFNIFTDEEWMRLLSIADPSLDPASRESVWVRLKVGYAASIAYTGYRDKKDGGGEQKSYEDVARAGEVFIRGMLEFDSDLRFMRSKLLHYDPTAFNGRPDKIRSIFDKELALKIQDFCALLRQIESLFKPLEGSASKEGPNKKEWLHSAVLLLRDIWQDELGQGQRPKKDFLAFAYAVLQPLKIGVTENSVLESFDRHVKHNKDLRRNLMREGI